MKQEYGIVSKTSNIGHILKYRIGVISDLNFQYHPSLFVSIPESSNKLSTHLAVRHLDVTLPSVLTCLNIPKVVLSF